MRRIELDHGESILVHETEIDDTPLVLCVETEVFDAESLLNHITQNISSSWPNLYSIMKTGFEDYGHADEFPPERFFLNLTRITPDVYMGDKSDIHFRFEFEVEKFSESLPFYDFYMNDHLEIIHHQPVF